MTGVRDVAAGLRDYEQWLNDPRPRIGWRLPFFDSRSNGGIARSEICMVNAYSSVGKTSLALNVIRNNPDVPTLFISLEMNWRMVVARLAAIESGQTTVNIENDLQAKRSNHGLLQVVDKFRLLACDDTPGQSVKDCDASFERATEIIGERPRLVIFDYLELLGGGGLSVKTEAVDKAAQKLRDWTRKWDCSTIVLHQIGINDGGHRPLDLSSGRYGGHQPMDFVVGAYAPRLEPGIDMYAFEACKDEVFLQLLKNRSGGAYPVGVKHRLDHRTMRLTEWHVPAFLTGQPSALPLGGSE